MLGSILGPLILGSLPSGSFCSVLGPLIVGSRWKVDPEEGTLEHNRSMIGKDLPASLCSRYIPTLLLRFPVSGPSNLSVQG